MEKNLSQSQEDKRAANGQIEKANARADKLDKELNKVRDAMAKTVSYAEFQQAQQKVGGAEGGLRQKGVGCRGDMAHPPPSRSLHWRRSWRPTGCR
jgi:predicted  nucleic acid-binding Zn-ribbon protein